MSWTTPTLVEICIGLEINGYLPAEFWPRLQCFKEFLAEAERPDVLGNLIGAFHSPVLMNASTGMLGTILSSRPSRAISSDPGTRRTEY
jgi:coenzyme PQQ precursor peptide PqqA